MRLLILFTSKSESIVLDLYAVRLLIFFTSKSEVRVKALTVERYCIGAI